MSTQAVTFASPSASKSHDSEAPASARPPILSERWPALGRAIGDYQARETAERFGRSAYDAVVSGLIRHSDRQRLAGLAQEMGIRPFDAQLLIACSIRQWVLDHRYDGSPSPRAPVLSLEYRAWRRTWMRAALVIATAVILDGIIIWKWLGL